MRELVTYFLALDSDMSRANVPYLSGSRVLVDEAADWIGERIEHSLSDLAVLSLSAAPSFYLWLFI